MITGKEGLLNAMTEAFVMEKTTSEFYGEAKEKAQAPAAKKAFEELAVWEQEHMQYIQFLYQSFLDERETVSFEQFRDKVQGSEVEGGTPVKDLEAKIEKHTFANEREAVKVALEIEARAFTLYNRIASETDDTNLQVFMKDMAQWEEKHVQYLKNLESQLA